MNPTIEKLKKIERRAAALAVMRGNNELRWEKAYEAARKTPEWKAHCEQTGSVTNYNYGDVTC